jgi:hypothetical protein
VYECDSQTPSNKLDFAINHFSSLWTINIYFSHESYACITIFIYKTSTLTCYFCAYLNFSRNNLINIGAWKISMTYIQSHSSKRKFLDLRVGWGSRIGCISAKNSNISKHQVGLTSTIVLWGWHIFLKWK